MAKIAVLLGDDFEDSEYRKPVDRLEREGHEVLVLGVRAHQELRGKKGEEMVKTDDAVSERRPDEFDAILIPGGFSPDHIRTDRGMVDFVRKFVKLERPVAAVCHGPQLLIEADVVKGRTMTSWPSVRKDLENAGARVVDEEVCEDGIFITSRKPGDLAAFSSALAARLDATTTRIPRDAEERLTSR